MEALATAGVFDGLGLSRRDALWAAGTAARERRHHLPGLTAPAAAPALPGMSLLEITQADVWATGISPDTHPVEFLRRQLTTLHALPTTAVATIHNGTRVLVGGAITHRQRPGTASGITFLNLEDEFGTLNVVCSAGLWRRYRAVALASTAMLVRGTVQIGDGGVASLYADHLEPLRLGVAHTSRDFR
jgi:error-prone DNA polymerase